MVTEAVRAAPEEVAGTAPHLLDDVVDEDWGRHGGRPVRLGKNPTKPRPGSSPPATTPSGSWNTSTGRERTVRRALVSRPCARSWCRTITVTPWAACAGAPPRPKADPGCRPRPGRSSRPHDISARYARHGHIIS